MVLRHRQRGIALLYPRRRLIQGFRTTLCQRLSGIGLTVCATCFGYEQSNTIDSEIKMLKIEARRYAAALSLLALISGGSVPGCATPPKEETKKIPSAMVGTAILPHAVLGAKYFGNDAAWYEQNIPFFSCSDSEIEQIYYYRWKLYKSHLKDLGDRGYIVTEFLDDVSWSLKPYESLNDATGFHINEGRWLKDRRYVNDYIDFMYHGGNDRHFSEAIADAAYAHYLVNGDRAFAIKNLEAMKRIYRQWDDHYDAAKSMYFIEPLLDATEYTISSVDASGGKEGFRGGDAFRPSINSFQFANALAISKLSAMTGDAASAKEYAAKATTLRDLTQKNLWNDNYQHFIDRYKVSNSFVHYWDFIRGRELAGYTPWYFNLPDKDARYNAAWSHILSPAELGGPYGIRTVEPSYEYYMKQYRYVLEDSVSKPECQWNGPSWPFQTTLALGGMANLLNNYSSQSVIHTDDYLRLLQQYTKQHFQNGQPDLQEDYNPDTGNAIVGLHRSHHYNHSGYNDLVITGLVGLRPRADDVLEINPLVPTSAKAGMPISYFCLENVLYHGRLITVVYDRDGKKYNKGVGLSVYVDGQQVVKPSPLGKKTITLPKSMVALASPSPANMAVNPSRTGFPIPAASVNAASGDMYQAIDGRVWFYPNVRNYWTNQGSQEKSDWFGVDFGHIETVDTAKLYFYSDVGQLKAPTGATVQYWTGQDWTDVKSTPVKPLANGETVLSFSPVETSKLRVVFVNPPGASVALVEMKAFGTKVVAARDLMDASRVGAGLPLELDGLQQENSRTGQFNGVRWRDAENGGFFAFHLPTVVNAKNALVVSYWGGDAGNRRFDVLVNDVKMGEQVLENNRPGEFFDVTYPIPEVLTRGKSKVTVRFQAKPGAVAGGVFGIRIVRP